jgi:hypothetical protein
MPDRNKNSRSSLSDFLRYREGSIKGEERNAFEKKLQKDPFSEEAAEGFELISASEAAEDLEQLTKNLRKRAGSNRRIVYYRIAAALAALVVISSLFIFIKPEKHQVTISQNTGNEERPETALSIPEPQKIQAPSGGEVSEKKVNTVKERSDRELKVAGAERKDMGKVAESDIKADEITGKEAQKTEAEPATPAAEINNVREAAASRASPVSIKGKNVMQENYVPPMPANGRDSFVSYLENNLRNPEPVNASEQSVTLRFLVKKDSTISGIRILNSPGGLYTSEALRLIREGPYWIPALRNNKVVEDSATVNIVFR